MATINKAQVLTIYLRSGSVLKVPLLPNAGDVKWKWKADELQSLNVEGIGPGINGIWFSTSDVEAFTIEEV